MLAALEAEHDRSAEAVVQAGVVLGGQAKCSRFRMTVINALLCLAPACDTEFLE